MLKNTFFIQLYEIYLVIKTGIIYFTTHKFLSLFGSENFFIIQYAWVTR